jgi:hypothetical protein
MREREARKLISVTRIGKLDPRLPNVATSLAQGIGHDLHHTECLLANREVDEQNPGLRRCRCRRSPVYRKALAEADLAASVGNANLSTAGRGAHGVHVSSGRVATRDRGS